MDPQSGLTERLIRAGLDGALPLMVVLVALACGAFALVNTPVEEEPQIVVPMADVHIAAPSLSARQVERLVTTPLEKVLTQIDGVEHIYSTSRTGGAVVSVRFFVGEDREDSLIKLYNKVLSNQDLVPSTVESWTIKPLEIDDVPVLIATLWSNDESVSDFELRRLAEEVALDLQAIPDTNRIDITGGRPRVLRVELDITAMSARNTGIDDVLFALSASNIRSPAGIVERGDLALNLETNARIEDAEALASLTINVIDGITVRLRDVARITDGPDERQDYHWIAFGAARADSAASERFAAVDIAVAKKKGANAVAVAEAAVSRIDALTRTLFPHGVHVEITRNYGDTADAKISDLLASLVIAVATVVALISVFLGWRAALVVAITVPVCYGITLMLDFAAGYTINRVTLFALILALGLLVDDPITGVDNMERHLGRGEINDDIVRALMEIRVPLLMSTVAIVIAFAPMSFITGMMGPYMSPMAFNVPIAVVMSTIVAFVVTPWLGSRLLKPTQQQEPAAADSSLYRRLLTPLLNDRRRAWTMLGLTAAALVIAMLLPLLRVVPLKLLPYDNKDEFQVLLDAPEGTTLERTDAVLAKVAQLLTTVPEVISVTGYSGTHSAMDFNGLVRHYFLRAGDHEGELRVQLVDKLARAQQSHSLILRLRPQIAALAQAEGVSIKLVEVPPGPPVIASVVAELYGQPTTEYPMLIAAARATAQRLAAEVGVVDVDTSATEASQRMVYVPDREKAALSGVSAANLARALRVGSDGLITGYIDAPDEAQPLPIKVTIPYSRRGDLAYLQVKGMSGVAKIREQGGVKDAPTPLVSMAELGRFELVPDDQPIYHKDLRPVTYAFAEVAGRVPAEVIYDVDADLHGAHAASVPVEERTYFNSGAGQPWQLPGEVDVVWSGEGEWNITLRVFRDLGIAFGVAILGLFAVIRLQTGSANLALIILLAIPLTAIGIMPGFWILNLIASQTISGYPDPVLFTATAMIGMIALAGIVVRNSLILIEFIEQQRALGIGVHDAVLAAGAARTRPVLLTAATTLLGNLVITLDPIFSGLAWAIIFGIVASTALTLIVVPTVYALVYTNQRSVNSQQERGDNV